MFLRHASHHRLDNLCHHARLKRGRKDRTWRERAHAAGVRTPIAVEDPFVILRAADGKRPCSVAHQEERHLRPRQTLFDHDRLARRAEFSLAHRRNECGFRFALRLSDDDALARREAIRFENHRRAERFTPHHRQRIVE